MPAAENGFQILNLHPKIHRKTKQKSFFVMHIYPNNTKNSTTTYDLKCEKQNWVEMLNWIGRKTQKN